MSCSNYLPLLFFSMYLPYQFSINDGRPQWSATLTFVAINVESPASLFNFYLNLTHSSYLDQIQSRQILGSRDSK
jgi:hypothetical protein